MLSRRLLLIVLGFSIFFCQTKAQDIYTELKSKLKYVVSHDGSGNFTTIQAAINAVPDNSATRTILFVKNGIYNEKVTIPETKKKLVIVGENVDKTILTWNENSTLTWVRDNNNNILSGPHVATTLAADADDLWMMNMTIENSYGYAFAGPQALAIRTKGDKQVFLHCKFFSFQDTYMTFGRGRNYTKDCVIAGAVDFIFGTGVNVFDSCLLYNTRDGGYFTAASTDTAWKFGYVFLNNKLISAKGNASMRLGRTFSNYTNNVFFKCDEGNLIHPEGWLRWATQTNFTFFVAEYKCTNTGSLSSRISWSKQLTDNEAARYTLDSIFDKNVTAPPYPPYSASWKPNVDKDSIYKIVKKYTKLYLDTTGSNNANIKSLMANGSDINGFNANQLISKIDVTDSVIPVLYPSTEAIGSVCFISLPTKTPGFGTILVTAGNRTGSKSYKVYYNKDGAYTNANITKFKYDTTNMMLTNGKFDYRITLSDSLAKQIRNGKSIYVSALGNVTGSGIKYSKQLLTIFPDTVMVTVTAPDQATSNTYKFYISLPTAVSKQSTNTSKIVFTNPFNEELEGQYELDKPSKVKISIYNNSGEKVYSESLGLVSSGKKSIRIDSKNLYPGCYYYKIQIEEQELNGKLLKVK